MLITNSGYHLFFNYGGFDPYCVYIDGNEYDFYKPLDSDYFIWIRNLADKYGVDKVYNDFKYVYNAVNDDYDENECLSVCMHVDKNYKEDTTHWWCIFFMTMYAEMKKEGAILKKRIKHLAVYNILFSAFAA